MVRPVVGDWADCSRVHSAAHLQKGRSTRKVVRFAVYLHDRGHYRRCTPGALSFLRARVLPRQSSRDAQGVGRRTCQPRGGDRHYYRGVALLPENYQAKHALDVRPGDGAHRFYSGDDSLREPDESRDLWWPYRPALGFPVYHQYSLLDAGSGADIL